MPKFTPAKPSFFRRTIDKKPWTAIIGCAALTTLGTQGVQYASNIGSKYVESVMPIDATVLISVPHKIASLGNIEGAVVTLTDPKTGSQIGTPFITNNLGVGTTEIRVKPGFVTVVVKHQYSGTAYQVTRTVEVKGSTQTNIPFSEAEWAPVSTPLKPDHSAAPVQIASGTIPPWLAAAYKEMGQREIAGPRNNMRIIEYLRTIRDIDISNVQDDEIDWASAFAEWSLAQAGLSGPKKISPRSWLNWGRVIEEPEVGCIVIFQFGNLDHVGFFVGYDGNSLSVLGGNQSDAVQISRYQKSTAVGFRMPP